MSGERVKCAGVILAGGESRRMGVDKASLDFGGEAMLVRVARVLSAICSPIVVVAAPGQVLPAMPQISAGVIDVVHDRQSGRGPMEGLSVGLARVAALAMGQGNGGEEFAEDFAALVTTCDAPLITAAFVSRLLEFVDWESFDAAVPIDEVRRYPLSAIYGPAALPVIEQRVQAGKLKVIDMLDEIRTRFVDSSELRTADPELLSLLNINSPEEYESIKSRSDSQL